MADQKKSPGPAPAAPKQECPQPYYCEYYYDGGEWWPISANTQTGYYCPDEPSEITNGVPGETRCQEPSLIPTQVVDKGGYPAGVPAAMRLCEYEFRDGHFYFRGGNCPPGYYCPTNPEAFVRKHGATVMFWSFEDDRITVRMMPASITDCRASGHSSEHQPA